MILIKKYICVILFLFLSCASVEASGVYSPRSIEVDEVAITAVKAKENGFKKAKLQAWEQLLNDLLLVQSSEKLIPTDIEMDNVVQTIEVVREKTRNNRYIAEIIVYFNHQQVRSLFQQKGISFTSERAFPLLIVPVFEDKGVHKIYEVGNLWRESLGSNPKVGGLIPIFLVPEGYKASLKIDKRVINDFEKLLSVSKYYGAEGAIVSTVSLNTKTNTLELQWYSRGGYFKNSKGRVTQVVKKDNVKNALVALTYNFYASIEDAWREVQIAGRELGEYENSIMFSTTGVSDLQNLKRSLLSLPSVESIELQKIEAGLVTFLVRFYLTKNKFRTTLKREGYKIQKGNKYWVVTRP